MTAKYGNRTYNWFETLVNKIGDEDRVEAFLHDEFILVPKVVPEWKVWLKIELGTKTVDDFCRLIKRRFINTGEKLEDVLRDPAFTVASEEYEIDLVKVTGVDLGFNRREVSYREICTRAKKFGLDYCPAEVGPQLRLQYRDQPDEERLPIVMKPLNTKRWGSRTFSVDKPYFDIAEQSILDYQGLVLDCNDMRPNDKCSTRHHFVFALPRRK